VIVAGVGALLLLLVMSLDWYSTATGDEARRIERITEGADGAEAGEIDRRLNEEAGFVAEREEKNAWQVDALVDRILLGLMLAAIALAVLTWFTRALGAKPNTTGIGPAGLAALLATARIIQEPGLDAGTHVKLGAPLALVPLAMIALGGSYTLRADDREAEDGGAD
jgi:hypothetical protein